MKTLKAAMQVSVTDLHLDWELGGSAKLVQVPRELPPLFAGDRLIVYAFNNGQQVIDLSVIPNIPEYSFCSWPSFISVHVSLVAKNEGV